MVHEGIEPEAPPPPPPLPVLTAFSSGCCSVGGLLLVVIVVARCVPFRSCLPPPISPRNKNWIGSEVCGSGSVCVCGLRGLAKPLYLPRALAGPQEFPPPRPSVRWVFSESVGVVPAFRVSSFRPDLFVCVWNFHR